MTKRINIKLISNMIVFASIIFVLIYLYENHLLVTLKISNYFYLFISIVILMLGFLMDAFTIRLFLKLNDIKLSLHESVCLTGKYMLAKYIPGKIGVIIGKAAFIYEKSPVSKYRSIEIVFVYQFLFLISAAILSISTLFDFLNVQSVHVQYFLPILIFLVILFSFRKSQQMIKFVLAKITRRDFIGIYSQKSIFFVVVGTMFCWLLWAFGFWVMAVSIGIAISIHAALLFPLAAVIGVIVIISPGGLGVREGVISAGLIFFGLAKTDAISLSVYSRLWFLFGEIVFFLLAILTPGNFNKKPA